VADALRTLDACGAVAEGDSAELPLRGYHSGGFYTAVRLPHSSHHHRDRPRDEAIQQGV
jgi:hypothetical protein